jgi:hypothetical protein
MIASSRIKLTEHVGRILDMRNAYKVLLTNSKGKRKFGIP